MKLTIIIICYNHEQFIEECLKSVFNQKVNFQIEFIIADDVSTDKSREIISKFIINYSDRKINVLFRDKNLGLSQNYFTAVDQANGEYIATISGDDYWIDTEKIQKQVDFLENNKTFSVCCTHFKYFNSLKNEFIETILPVKHIYSHADIVKSVPVVAGTAMFRVSMLKLPLKARRLSVEDWPMWWFLSLKGPIKFIPDITLVYRKHHNNYYESRTWTAQRKLLLKLKYDLNNLTNSITPITYLNQEKSKFIDVLISNLNKDEKLETLTIYCELCQYKNKYLLKMLRILPNFLFIILFKISYRITFSKINELNAK